MTQVSDDVVRGLMRALEGFTDAYGTYDSASPNDRKGGKLEIKASAVTVRKPVTLERWRLHVDGVEPIGVIPIRDNNTCLWGVIDVDSYDVNLLALRKSCESEELPLAVCRSKSGGAHLFLFLLDPADAAVVQERLKAMAALLGHGNAEVFPKQRKVHVERGDLGSWLNMPYFGGDETDRYCVSDEGTPMTTGEFVVYADSLAVSSEYLEDRDFRKRHTGEVKKDPDFGDGPPCMQHLSVAGFPEGMRNVGLFNLATFAKKKYGTRWTEVLDRWNNSFFDPPLSSTEVADIVKSQEKKEYFYECKKNPLVAHCNSTTCRSRKFGVGGDDDFPILSGLSYLDTDPPLWFLDVGTHRLELSTDELSNYRLFHKVCMERLFVCFRMLKQNDWIQTIGVAMREATRIEASPEVGLVGHFGEILEDFVVNRHRGKQKEDILTGRPWEDEENRRHYFRLKDLQKFLDAANFKIYNRGQITTRLRALGGNNEFWNLSGKGVNVWWIPSEFAPHPTPTPPTHKFAREPL